MSEHPEDTCEDCGRLNISWSIDSDRWNHVVRNQVGHDLMLCPSCFVKRHEKVTGMVASWTLVPATPFRWPENDNDDGTFVIDWSRARLRTADGVGRFPVGE